MNYKQYNFYPKLVGKITLYDATSACDDLISNTSCPKCKTTVYSDYERPVLDSNPQQIPVLCRNCNWSGYYIEPFENA